MQAVRSRRAARMRGRGQRASSARWRASSAAACSAAAASQSPTRCWCRASRPSTCARTASASAAAPALAACRASLLSKLPFPCVRTAFASAAVAVLAACGTAHGSKPSGQPFPCARGVSGQNRCPGCLRPCTPQQAPWPALLLRSHERSPLPKRLPNALAACGAPPLSKSLWPALPQRPHGIRLSQHRRPAALLLAALTGSASPPACQRSGDLPAKPAAHRWR